jgi:uncharacterized protein (TIGR03067 family)
MKDHPDLAALEGTWRLSGLALEGAELPAEYVEKLALTLEFRGSTVVITATKEKARTTATVRVDSTTQPRRLLFINEKTTDLGGKPVEITRMGTPFYKLEGDVLTLAGVGESAGKKVDEGRDAFAGKSGSNVAVLTFKRK